MEGGMGTTKYIFLLLLVSSVLGRDMLEEEDDDMGYSLGLLFREPDRPFNPHDMLTRPGERRLPTHPTEMTQESENQERKGECEDKASKELTECLIRLEDSQKSLEREQAASLQLQKILAKEGGLDLQMFYKRVVQHLWNTLKLQDVRDILQEGNTALIRHLVVRVTNEDLEGLDDYLTNGDHPRKVDEFLEHGFVLDETPPETPTPLLDSALTLAKAVMHAGKDLEVWLYVLCVSFVMLVCWVMVLFVKDVQKDLRWGSVLTMMAIVGFFICCVWHWRHLYKVAESRRHAQLAKRGYSGIPEECHPGSSTAGSVFDWIKVNIYGSPDVCEKYFEELMIDSLDEITPGMVVAETLSKFLLQPLQHLGTESGKLTTNFYKNVPPALHLHATFLFLGLLVVVLFYGCAYGIDFPLGLGGYRPMTRQTSTIDEGKIRREAMEQLNKDREKFLDESRRMLNDISQAMQGTQGTQRQVLVTSSSILETRLERLISQHLDKAMAQPRPTQPSVHTITSTPLRAEGREKLTGIEDEDHAEKEQSFGLLGEISSSSEDSLELTNGPVVVDDKGDPTGLLVSTDAVHRRVVGTTPVSCLPPRDPTTCSRGSSASTTPANTPDPSEAGSPSARRHKANKFMRMFRSTESAPSPLPSPSPSASSRSLGQASLDEPDLGTAPDSQSFLEEVRNVLNISPTSSP